MAGVVARVRTDSLEEAIRVAASLLDRVQADEVTAEEALTEKRRVVDHLDAFERAVRDVVPDA